MLELGKYKHFKGNEYEVVGLARNSETMEWMVIYKALYGDYGTWVRTLSMFKENVEVDGKVVERFKFLGNEKNR